MTRVFIIFLTIFLKIPLKKKEKHLVDNIFCIESRIIVRFWTWLQNLERCVRKNTHVVTKTFSPSCDMANSKVNLTWSFSFSLMKPLVFGEGDRLPCPAVKSAFAFLSSFNSRCIFSDRLIYWSRCFFSPSRWRSFSSATAARKVKVERKYSVLGKSCNSHLPFSTYPPRTLLVEWTVVAPNCRINPAERDMKYRSFVLEVEKMLPENHKHWIAIPSDSLYRNLVEPVRSECSFRKHRWSTLKPLAAAAACTRCF